MKRFHSTAALALNLTTAAQAARDTGLVVGDDSRKLSVAGFNSTMKANFVNGTKVEVFA